jgi:hypothetical protein
MPAPFPPCARTVEFWIAMASTTDAALVEEAHYPAPMAGALLERASITELTMRSELRRAVPDVDQPLAVKTHLIYWSQMNALAQTERCGRGFDLRIS